MAFTATYILKLNNNPDSTPITYSIADAYFKFGIATGGKQSGSWVAPLSVFVNEATRHVDVGDVIPSAPVQMFTVPWVSGQDVCKDLYDAAKAVYPDAVDVIGS